MYAEVKKVGLTKGLTMVIAASVGPTMPDWTSGLYLGGKYIGFNKHKLSQKCPFKSRNVESLIFEEKLRKPAGTANNPLSLPNIREYLFLNFLLVSPK